MKEYKQQKKNKLTFDFTLAITTACLICAQIYFVLAALANIVDLTGAVETRINVSIQLQVRVIEYVIALARV